MFIECSQPQSRAHSRRILLHADAHTMHVHVHNHFWEECWLHSNDTYINVGTILEPYFWDILPPYHLICAMVKSWIVYDSIPGDGHQSSSVHEWFPLWDGTAATATGPWRDPAMPQCCYSLGGQGGERGLGLSPHTGIWWFGAPIFIAISTWFWGNSPNQKSSKINRRGLLMWSWHRPTEGCSTRFFDDFCTARCWNTVEVNIAKKCIEQGHGFFTSQTSEGIC